MENESEGRLYLAGLYFAITTLTTVGYGDISAGTTGEYIICILWMMFGVGFYSLLAGTLSSVLT
jgi:voltage-gated potassium channel Kch